MTNISKFLNPDGNVVDVNPDTSGKLSSVIAAATSAIAAGRFVVDNGSGFLYPEPNGTVVDGVIVTAVDNSANSTVTSKAFTAITHGPVRMGCEAAITKGDKIGIGAYGRAKTYVVGKMCGRALTASYGDDVVVVQLELGGGA